MQTERNPKEPDQPGLGECRTGTVELVGSSRAWLKVSKSRCGTCAIAGQCLAGVDGGTDLVEVQDPIGVRPGQVVTFGTRAGSEFKIACTLYLLPAICLILGVVLGQQVGELVGFDPMIFSIFTGLASAVIAWLPAFFMARRKVVIPVIIDVVQED